MVNVKPGRLKKNLLYFLSGILGLILLIYAFIAVSSLTGREKIIVNDLVRYYRVHIPASYSDEEPAALVLVYHMLTTSGKTMEWLTHFNRIADLEGFIVVYPEGYKNSWAEGSQLYAADQANIDDVLFTKALIDRISSKYSVDSSRIYATGFSSGGMMVQRLGCDLSEQLAGIAVIGATFPIKTYQQCNPEKAIPVLMIHGSEDAGVPWQGDPDYTSIPKSVEFWLNNNGCNETPEKGSFFDVKDDDTSIEINRYTNCSSGKNVTLFRVQGGGHAWPGRNKAVQLWGLNGKISQEIDASQEIWDFFSHQ